MVPNVIRCVHNHLLLYGDQHLTPKKCKDQGIKHHLTRLPIGMKKLIINGDRLARHLHGHNPPKSSDCIILTQLGLSVNVAFIELKTRPRRQFNPDEFVRKMKSSYMDFLEVLSRGNCILNSIVIRCLFIAVAVSFDISLKKKIYRLDFRFNNHQPYKIATAKSCRDKLGTYIHNLPLMYIP